MHLLIIAAVVILLFLLLKPYFMRYDTIVFFGGGPGSGKTYMSTKYLRILLVKNRIKVAIMNSVIFVANRLKPKSKRKPYEPKPLAYSNIPVWVSKKEAAIVLTSEHLLLQRRIVPRSVLLLDELDGFANQFEFGQINLIRQAISSKNREPVDWEHFGAAFDEFIRFIRHYTQGGYLVCNTQCSANALLQIRRRINTVFNLFDIKFWGIPFGPKFISTVRVRNITISEEVRAIEENHKENNMSILFTLVPWYRMYDTYCYRQRYLTVPYKTEKRWAKLTTNKFLCCPVELQRKYTTGAELGDFDFDVIIEGEFDYEFHDNIEPYEDDDPELLD